MMFEMVCIFSLVGIALVLTVITEIVVVKIKRQNKAAEITAQSYEMCDACGENPKAPNSQICKECQKKVYDD